MSKRERIGVAVLVALVALSALLVWLCRKPDTASQPMEVPYYKQIQAMHDTVADTVSSKKPRPHSSHKSKKSKQQKPKPQPRSPLDEPC